jgi:hypothetical protein
MKRGASIASWMSIPKWNAFSATCSMAWTWLSPPGAPNGITEPSSRRRMAGFGVSRGLFPGATPDGWFGSGRDCVPRPDGTMPSAGTTGERHDASDGVAENAFPQRSTTHRYDVSGSRSDGPVAASNGALL